MNIIIPKYAWNGSRTKRSKTDTLILHHCGGVGMTAEQIHQLHLNNGWCGIGYHYYIRLDGSVYRGREEDTVGAHAGSSSNYNSRSIGICFEGNYETTTAMPDPQFKSGQALIKDILSRYPKLAILRHRDVAATACPGKYFPFDKMIKLESEEKQLTEKEVRALVKTLIDESKTVYKTIDDVPDWGKPTMKKLIDKGYIKGDTTGLNVPYESLRLFVVLDNAGVFR